MTRKADSSPNGSADALLREAAERAAAFDPRTDWEPRGGAGARRRSFLTLALAFGAASLGGTARAQGRVPFRMDEINAIHYLSTSFIEANLPPNSGIEWRMVRVGSVGIFDVKGQLLVLTAIAPLHFSAPLGVVEHVSRHFPLETLRPGDGILANDPHNGGGSHLPDLTVATPVFADGRVVAFVCNIAHHSDVGGKTPGERDGDLKAQVATNATGVRRVEGIFARFGQAEALAAFDAILVHGEARARAAVAALSRGSWSNEDIVDGGGPGTRRDVQVFAEDGHDDGAAPRPVAAPRRRRQPHHYTGADRRRAAWPGGVNLLHGQQVRSARWPSGNARFG